MNAMLSFLSGPLTESLGWALVHSLWQGVLLAVAVAMALRAMPHQSAATRYTVALSGLALQLLAFGLTAWVCYPAARASFPAEFSQPLLSTPVRVNSTPFDLRLFLQTHFPSVVLVWAVGAGVLALRLLGGWVLVQRWANRGSRPAPLAWQRHLDRLAHQAGITRTVRLLESARVSVPMTVGWLKPVVLLPVGLLTGLSPAQVEAVLAHELAHIGRHDYLVNLLQSVVETLFFYHPALWWLSARVRREREHDCDERAVALTGNRLALAQALTALEGFRQAPVPELALAFGGQKMALLDRVKRVLGVENASPARRNGWTLGLCLLLVAVLTIGQVAPPEKSKKATSRTESRLRSGRAVPPPPPAAPDAPPAPDTPGVPAPPPPPPPAAPPVPRQLPSDSIRTKRAFRQLDSLTKEMNAYLDARRPQLEKLQRELADTQAKASAEQLSRYAKPMAELAQKHAKMYEDLARLETAQQKKRGSQALLDQKQKAIAELERQMEALSERMEADAARMEPVWERNALLADSLARLYEPINELSERIGEASARISEWMTEEISEDFEGFEPFAPMAPARATRPAKPAKTPKATSPGLRTTSPAPALAPASPLRSTAPALAPTPSVPASPRTKPVIDPKTGIVGPATAPSPKPTPRPKVATTPQPAKAPK